MTYAIEIFGLTIPRLTTIIVLGLLAAFFEGFGMTMLLPVLDYVEKGQNVSQLKNSSDMWYGLFEIYNWFGIDINLLNLVSICILIMLVRVVVMYMRQIYTGWLGNEMMHVTRSNLLKTYLRMDYGFSMTAHTGRQLNILTTEAQRAVGSFSALFALVSNIAVLLGFLVILFFLSTPLTILAGVILGLAAILVTYSLRRTRSFSVDATNANDQFSRLLIECLTAFRLIKLTGTSVREGEKVQRASKSVRDIHNWLVRVAARVDLIIEPVVLILGGAILYFAVGLFGMSLSEVGVFVLILLRILPLAKEIMRSRQTYLSCSGSLNIVIDSYKQAFSALERLGGPTHLKALKQSIEFKDVTFSYPGTRIPAIQNIDLTIPAGKLTALVGHSGAGKTTLADIISRLWTPQTGKVLYDGIDGCELQVTSIRHCIAYVSQDAIILDNSVAANLRFVKDEATEEELWDALSKAGAEDFVRAFDGGLETQLGERGTKLSGGQKQRLSLARAFLQRASIMILDEPTSALDSETEADILATLDNLCAKESITIIVIAHRLSTIRNADYIVVLKDGRVVEQGSHCDLIVSEEWYARSFGVQTVKS